MENIVITKHNCVCLFNDGRTIITIILLLLIFITILKRVAEI